MPGCCLPPPRAIWGRVPSPVRFRGGSGAHVFASANSFLYTRLVFTVEASIPFYPWDDRIRSGPLRPSGFYFPDLSLDWPVLYRPRQLGFVLLVTFAFEALVKLQFFCRVFLPVIDKLVAAFSRSCFALRARPRRGERVIYACLRFGFRQGPRTRAILCVSAGAAPTSVVPPFPEGLYRPRSRSSGLSWDAFLFRSSLPRVRRVLSS